MNTRLVWLIIILLAAAAAGWHQTTGELNFISEIVKLVRHAPTDQSLLAIQHYVSTPGPLRVPINQAADNVTLTATGVLHHTNAQRQQNGFSPLESNSLLNQAAQAKLNDMLAKQYFDHIGPDNRGPSDWVNDSNYNYISVGENLALGNFASEADLVQAWMDSPGHRANILSTGFTGLGVAVAPGIFEGKRTWLAVQTFGLPQSACPTPESALSKTLDQKRSQFKTLEQALTDQKLGLDTLLGELDAWLADIDQLRRDGQTKIQSGNAKITQGNEIYEQTGSRQQAQPYWEEGERLQAEGQALLDQATTRQAEAQVKQDALIAAQNSYNSDVKDINNLHDEINQLVDQLNSQIRRFNGCAASFAK